MGTYLVRAGLQTPEEFNVFFRNGVNDVVAVGWSKINFSGHTDPETLVEAVRQEYYADNKTARQVIGRKLNEIRRFKGLRPGDRVVVPYFNQVRLGEIANGGLYDATFADSLDLSNQYPVNYLMNNGQYISILRTEFKGALQSRLRVPGTAVIDLDEFESDLNEFFTNPSRKWDQAFAEADRNYAITWQKKLLRNIAERKNYLQAGGRGLEELVHYLLELDGYEAKILGKSRFAELADADIKAIKSDRCSETKLFVQVKHHEGKSDSWGAEQLAKIRHAQDKDPEISDYEMVLVTSADASLELRDACASQDIKLIVGTDLAEWIYLHLANIGNAWRAKLGIACTGELMY